MPVGAFSLECGETCSRSTSSGQIAVTQALLPALIDSSGRVVNIQFRGRQGRHGAYGPYAGTRIRARAVSDSLRRELAPLGVDVVVVEPGAVRTEMLNRAGTARVLTSGSNGRYGGLVHAVTAQTQHPRRRGCLLTTRPA